MNEDTMRLKHISHPGINKRPWGFQKGGGKCNQNSSRLLGSHRRWKSMMSCPLNSKGENFPPELCSQTLCHRWSWENSAPGNFLRQWKEVVPWMWCKQRQAMAWKQETLFHITEKQRESQHNRFKVEQEWWPQGWGSQKKNQQRYSDMSDCGQELWEAYEVLTSSLSCSLGGVPTLCTFCSTCSHLLYLSLFFSFNLQFWSPSKMDHHLKISCVYCWLCLSPNKLLKVRDLYSLINVYQVPDTQEVSNWYWLHEFICYKYIKKPKQKKFRQLTFGKKWNFIYRKTESGYPT